MFLLRMTLSFAFDISIPQTLFICLLFFEYPIYKFDWIWKNLDFFPSISYCRILQWHIRCSSGVSQFELVSSYFCSLCRKPFTIIYRYEGKQKLRNRKRNYCYLLFFFNFIIFTNEWTNNEREENQLFKMLISVRHRMKSKHISKVMFLTKWLPS